MVQKVILLLALLALGGIGTFALTSPDSSVDEERIPAQTGKEINAHSAETQGGLAGSNSDMEREWPSQSLEGQAIADAAFEVKTGAPADTQPLGFHEIALSETEKENLLQAPSVFLSKAPSEVLAKAMELGRIEYIQADRDFSQNEHITQGWIYYEPLDGQVPRIVCVSQTAAIIDWMYCQEATRPQSP